MLELALIFFFPFLVIYAAFTDLFSMTIGNWITLALMAGFMVFALLIGMDWETIGKHWAMFGIILVITFVMFARGWIGGGDAKLAAAIALWMGWENSLEFFLLSSYLGGGLTIGIVYLRKMPIPDRYTWLTEQNWLASLFKAEKGIPYGISLGVSAMLLYANTIWMKHVFGAAAQI